MKACCIIQNENLLSNFLYFILYSTNHNQPCVRMVTRNNHLFIEFDAEPLHTIDVTNQAAKAMATYRDQIIELI